MDALYSNDPLRQHYLSTSFVDSAIDIDLTGTSIGSKSPAHAIPLSDRLTRLASLVIDQAPCSHLSEQDRSALHHYIDAVESFFDPRPELSREIAQNRPQRFSSDNVVKASSHDANLSGAQIPRLKFQVVNRRLTVLLEEISHVNAQLHQRRIESRHIHDLYTLKCDGMTRKIIQLEDEVHELQSNILEDSIELEGLRGTVRGLESWIGKWQRQRELSGIQPLAASPSPRKGRWRRRKRTQAADREDENDCDALLDGICGWMRGWRDIEEGSRIRARRRKMGRDQRSSPSNSVYESGL